MTAVNIHTDAPLKRGTDRTDTHFHKAVLKLELEGHTTGTGYVCVGDVADTLNMSESSARRRLRELEERSELESGYYFPTTGAGHKIGYKSLEGDTYADLVLSNRPNKPKWKPQLTSKRECRNCGSHVLKHTSRVFGDNDGTLHACPECAPKSQLRYLAHDPTAELRVQHDA